MKTSNESNLSTSLSMYDRAQSVLAGSVGHDLRYALPGPIYTARGKGGRKWDVDSNEYIDFLVGNAALLLGHADQEVVAAVQSVVADGTHFGNDHPLQLEWSEQIQQMVPSAERVRFTNSGTESTLLAIRLARAFTGRPGLLRLEGHFHGWHDDVVHGFDMPFQEPTCLGATPNDQRDVVCLSDRQIDRIDDLLSQQQTAAVIVESTGASWGRAPLGDKFLQAIDEITKRTGTIFILDEVISGFRFGAAGVQGIEGIRPDLTTFAKVVAGGMPGGAVVGRRDIMDLMQKNGDPHHDRHQRVVHFGTYNACPPSAAAAIVTLKRIQSTDVTHRVNTLGTNMRQALHDLIKSLGIAGHVYGQASLFHVYFETDSNRLSDISEQADVWIDDPARLKGMPGHLVARYQQLLRYNGVDLMSGTGGALCTAHTEADISEAITAFEKVLVKLLDEGLIFQI